jgi:hypothetical protein
LLILGVAAALPAEARAAADWDVSVAPNMVITIRHKGAVVAQGKHIFWGRNWLWTKGPFEIKDPRPEGGSFTSTIAGLGLKVAGTTHSPAPNIVQFDYRISASQSLDDVIGGGLEWKLKTDSASFDSKPPAPVLLDGKAGWSWAVGGPRGLSVTFQPATATTYFEGGQKNTIRTFLVHKTIRPGQMTVRMTIELPPGGRFAPDVSEKYEPEATGRWYQGVLDPTRSPIDLSALNAEDRPAGKRGFIKAEGDHMVFADGTPARFWGGNIAGMALFSKKEFIRPQAHRIAQLGYNLMRFHHHDSWGRPIAIDRSYPDSRHLDPEALDRIDWWIKCLKEEGVYVWLDLHVGRQLKPADQVGKGYEEVERAKGQLKGFNYFNPRIQELMKEFNHQYVNHVNPYTKLAYKNDPAIIGILITNENDLVHHFGNMMLPNKNNPFHNAQFTRAVNVFARASGLPAAKLGLTWVPGPSKLFLNEMEHEFNRSMIDDLRALGVKAPIATTNFWGGKESLFALPALCEGELVDVHSYGAAEALSANPRYESNFISWIGTAQVAGKPLTVTEWNVPFPTIDRCTAPLYMASISALQGWDAPMIYNYSQGPFNSPQVDAWSSWIDPALTGVMPAAAVAFRQGHVRPAQKTFYLKLDRSQFYDQAVNPDTSATIRTLVERSRLFVGLPAVKELPWSQPTTAPAGAEVVTEVDRDFITPGASSVQSDTGELTRDWERGIHTINTPKTQAAAGWIGGQSLTLKNVAIQAQTHKAVIAVTSLDDRPIPESRRLLVTALARAVASPGGKLPFLSEPVNATISIQSSAGSLTLLPLGARATGQRKFSLKSDRGTFRLTLPGAYGTHWFLLTDGPEEITSTPSARRAAR